MRAIVLFLAMLGLSVHCFAEEEKKVKMKEVYTCQIEVAKGKCWKDHAVNFYVNVERLPGTTTVTLSRDDFYKMVEFPCERQKVVAVSADIDPKIWSGEGNEDRKFLANQKWLTPFSVPEDAKYWKFRVCFHQDFPHAPRPMLDFSKCDCRFPIQQDKE